MSDPTQRPDDQRPDDQRPDEPRADVATSTPQAPAGAPQDPGPQASATPAAEAPVTDPTAPAGPTAHPATAAPAAKDDRGRRSTVPLIASLIVGALIGGAAGAGVTAWTFSSFIDEQPAAAPGPQTLTVNDPDDVTPVTAIAAKAAPSIVTITVASDRAGGGGSGIILSEDGYVLTNNHVVTLDGATNDPRIQVTTYDGRIYAAEIVGTDPLIDLAVIQLDNASGLQPIEWGESSELNVGDRTVVIGAPLGLANSVSDGIVSALNRSIQVASSAVPENPADEPQSPDDLFNFDIRGDDPTPPPTSGAISLPVIQTDAAVNHGNSGGGLVDDEGRLIGVIVAIAGTPGSGQSGSIGIGFAIPSDLAQRVAGEIIEDGAATHGLLGATVRNASSEDGGTIGAVVEEVTPGGAADEADIRPGDVITALGGLAITSSTDLVAQVRALPSGADTEVTYHRGGDETTVDVTLGSLE